MEGWCSKYFILYLARVYIGSARLFYIALYFIHHFIDGKQWNEVFLYPAVSKANSRTIP